MPMEYIEARERESEVSWFTQATIEVPLIDSNTFPSSLGIGRLVVFIPEGKTNLNSGV